jgi:hypothetical protein
MKTRTPRLKITPNTIPTRPYKNIINTGGRELMRMRPAPMLGS